MFVSYYQSPLGKIILQSDGEFLTGLGFASAMQNFSSDDFTEKNLPVFDDTANWLDIYFSGSCPDFTPRYKIYGLTPFRKTVIDILNTIPFGETVTYNDIAKQIAAMRGIKKMSAQAVGGAVGWNPICIIIPCHRVIGSDGSLTGYGGGIENKKKLLEIEKRIQ